MPKGSAARWGGTYRIAGSNEPATGFTLYLDRLADAAPQPEAARTCYLPLGHDRAAAAKLRAEGWRTRAQLAEGEDAAALGCDYVLTASGPAERERP